MLLPSLGVPEPWEYHRDTRACLGEAREAWRRAEHAARRGAWMAAVEQRGEGDILAVLALEALLHWLAGLDAL
jgi:hypothetical protein